MSPSEQGGKWLVGDGPQQGHRALRWRSAMGGTCWFRPCKPQGGEPRWWPACVPGFNPAACLWSHCLPGGGAWQGPLRG